MKLLVVLQGCPAGGFSEPTGDALACCAEVAARMQVVVASLLGTKVKIRPRQQLTKVSISWVSICSSA